MENPVEDDPHVRRAIEWLYDSSIDSTSLRQRVDSARDYYLERANFQSSSWQDIPSLLLPTDLIASYLVQAEAFIKDRYVYDVRIGSRIIPFLKTIGFGVNLLSNVLGASERAQRLTKPKNEHPDGDLFELVTAIRYAREIDCNVEFIPEGVKRTADFRACYERDEFHVECKRLQSSKYEKDELKMVQAMFLELECLIAEKHLNLYIDVVFLQEIKMIPLDYLERRVAKIIGSPLFLSKGYPWRDEYAEGCIRLADIDAVRRDTFNSDLFVGPKMARLLCGKSVSEGSYLMSVRGDVSKSDPRYLAVIKHGSVLTWNCMAPKSVDARGRFIRSKLADIDRQLEYAPLGIAHIGMDAERDTQTADLRQGRNKANVADFQFKSKLVNIQLHYFLPRISENHSWMSDETVDTFATELGPLLQNARVISAGEDMELADVTRSAWHQPPPSY